MLTCEPEEFEREFLRTGNPSGKYKDNPEAYHYLKAGNLLLRAQLDCHDPNLSGQHKSFDLKTRATWRVRTNIQDYEYEADRSTLNSVSGPGDTYQREFYDLCRSALLKYWFQVRIGEMSGIFLCYHSTKVIFGFEYLKREEMERILFGSEMLGNAVFHSSLQLFQIVLDAITARHPDSKTLRVVMHAQSYTNSMLIFAEEVDLEENKKPGSSLGMINFNTTKQDYIQDLTQRSKFSSEGRFQPTLSCFKLHTQAFLNGVPLERYPVYPWTINRSDIFYTLEDSTETTEKRIGQMLVKYQDLLRLSLIYEEYDDTPTK